MTTPQRVSPAQRKHLEDLLASAGVPQATALGWLARRHPGAYPEGVRMDRVWVTHAAEIERRIPQFVEALAMDARLDAAVAEQETQALATVRHKYDWNGDLAKLEELSEIAAERATVAARYMEARDGHIDPDDFILAQRLNREANLLAMALRAARR